MTDPVAAINAYKQVANLPSSNSSSTNSTAFSSLITNTLDNTAAKLQASEQVAIRAMAGEASVEQLTVALTEAEGALRTITAVRDRVISAYQDIIKMPI